MNAAIAFTLRSVPALLGLASALCLAGPARADGPPGRVVSTSLCGDELALALAGPGQLVALSRAATDPARSYYATAATAYPSDSGTAESVMSFAPDLVLVDGATPAATRDMLVRLGYQIAYVDPVATIDQAIAQVHDVAGLLGREAAGDQLAQLITSARFQAYDANWGVTAAYYGASGVIAGETDLVSDILKVIGLNNAAQDFVIGPGGHLSLEQLIAAPPDYLIVSDARPRAIDQATALLDHPALAALFPPEKRIELPERLTECGGPSLTEAIRLLASEFRRVSPTPPGRPPG